MNFVVVVVVVRRLSSSSLSWLQARWFLVYLPFWFKDCKSQTKINTKSLIYDNNWFFLFKKRICKKILYFSFKKEKYRNIYERRVWKGLYREKKKNFCLFFFHCLNFFGSLNFFLECVIFYSIFFFWSPHNKKLKQVWFVLLLETWWLEVKLCTVSELN